MKKLIIFAVILIAVLVGADFAAAATGEYQVSKKMRTELQLADDPAVRINGFPFLFQAFSGDYRDIFVQANGISVDSLKDIAVEADLRHAHAALSDLLSGSPKEIKIDEVDGRVKVNAKDVGRLLDIDDLTIDRASDKELRGDDSGDDSDSEDKHAPIKINKKDKTTAPVKLTGTKNIAGIDVKVTAIGVLSLVDGKLQVTPAAVTLRTDSGEAKLPPQFRPLVQKAFTTTLDPGKLPFTVTPTEVNVESGALVLGGKATDIVFNPGSAG